LTDVRQTTRALLLRSVDYGESDRIVTFFTEELGKISALARGARKSHRRFGGALEPFSLIEIGLESRRAGLMQIKDATLIEANPGLAKDLNRMGVASLILELIRETTAEQVSDRLLFEIAAKALELVASIELGKIVPILFAVQLRILSVSGVGVSILRCNACGRVVPPGKPVRFHPERGGVVCTPCGGGPVVLSKGAIGILARLSELPLQKIVDVRMPVAEAVEIDTVLNTYCDYHVERTIRSRTLVSIRKMLE
jgi:DNA repair protein RecO (recombination protein O)